MKDRPLRVPPCNSAAFLIPLNLPEGDQAGPRQVIVEHKPGKPSIILLKIMAMETHPANAERLDRRRRFCKDYVAPLKASPARER